MSTYNRGYIIERALKSIQNQEFQEWECIIIDDRSTDNTEQIIKNYMESDSRFFYIKKSLSLPKGISASRNIGLKLAKGKYYLFVDDDDIIHPALLKIIYNLFSKHNNVDFIHYKLKQFKGDFDERLLEPIKNINYREIFPPIWPKIITGKIPMASCSVVWNSKYLRKDFFDETLLYGEEREYFSRIAVNNPQIKGLIVDNELYFNWKHDESNTGVFHRGDEKYIKAYFMVFEKILIHVLKKDKFVYEIRKFYYDFIIRNKQYKLLKQIISKNIKYLFEFIFYKIKVELKHFLIVLKIYRFIKN